MLTLYIQQVYLLSYYPGTRLQLMRASSKIRE